MVLLRKLVRLLVAAIIGVAIGLCVCWLLRTCFLGGPILKWVAFALAVVATFGFLRVMAPAIRKAEDSAE